MEFANINQSTAQKYVKLGMPLPVKELKKKNTEKLKEERRSIQLIFGNEERYINTGRR